MGVQCFRMRAEEHDHVEARGGQLIRGKSQLGPLPGPSGVVLPVETTVTSSGSGRSFSSRSAGAPASHTRSPSPIPSFFARGVPE